MPRQVVNRTVTLVEVAKCGAVTVVVVDVRSMSEVTSPSYDLGVTKDELVSKWKKYYS